MKPVEHSVSTTTISLRMKKGQQLMMLSTASFPVFDETVLN